MRIVCKGIFGVAAAALLLPLLESSAHAWGPGVHTVTALHVLGHLPILLPSVAEILRACSFEYLYGCLAADFFIGKSRVWGTEHPHNWDGGAKFLAMAEDEREQAFAYGLLSHLAADVVAHNFFVPHLIVANRRRRKQGHFYWEVKADYAVGPEYTRFAEAVLGMDHHSCDDLLKSISVKTRNGMEASKRIYTQTVRMSGTLFATRDRIFPDTYVPRNAYQEYVRFMVDLSCRVVLDFLMNPQSSACLSYDPMGTQALTTARRTASARRLFRRGTLFEPIFDPSVLEP